MVIVEWSNWRASHYHHFCIGCLQSGALWHAVVPPVRMKEALCHFLSDRYVTLCEDNGATTAAWWRRGLLLRLFVNVNPPVFVLLSLENCLVCWTSCVLRRIARVVVNGAIVMNVTLGLRHGGVLVFNGGFETWWQRLRLDVAWRLGFEVRVDWLLFQKSFPV